MNIVITGGLGFLGSNLTKRLVADGHKVLIIDPGFLKGHPDLGVQPDEVIFVDPDRGYNTVGSHLDEGGKVEVWSGCTRSLKEFSCIREWKVDRIYHLGALASPPAYKTQPLESLLAGSEGTHAAFWLLDHNPMARLLLTSTSEVYGDPLVSPQSEIYRGNVDPIGPRSMYDEAKRYAEAYTAARIRGGDDARIARIFNTFGPGMALGDGRMITEFIRACLDGRPLPVHGDGSQTRTLCYVDDQIEGLIRLMEVSGREVRERDHSRGDYTPGPGPGPVNIGGVDEVTVTEVAEAVRASWLKLTQTEAPPIEYTDQPCEHDPRRRCPDISRAKQVLGWGPKVAWERGIELTVASHLLGWQGKD